MPPGRALAREDAAPATSERQQHACTNEVGRNATLHARKNASSFFNGVSTLPGGNFVKDKDSLPPDTSLGPDLTAADHRAVFSPIVSPDGGTIASWRPLQPLESMGSFRSHGAGDECGHAPQPAGQPRYSMEGKGRFIFPVLISALIVFVVSAVVTFTNIGLRVDFVPRWLKAFITGWPVAAVLAFFAVPHVRRATEIIVRFIDG
jgi:Protein of unknown function (DUF2798)